MAHGAAGEDEKWSSKEVPMGDDEVSDFTCDVPGLLADTFYVVEVGSRPRSASVCWKRCCFREWSASTLFYAHEHAMTVPPILHCTDMIPCIANARAGGYSLVPL